MKKFLLIGAAILIAGAATVAVAADHKGQKRAAHTSSAPAKSPGKVATARAADHKAAVAKHPGKRHHRHARPHPRTHRTK